MQRNSNIYSKTAGYLRKALILASLCSGLMLLASWSSPSAKGLRGSFRWQDTIVKTAYQQMIDSLYDLNLSPDSLRRMGLSEAILYSIDSVRKVDSLSRIKVYTPKELRRMKRDSVRKRTDSIIRNTPRVLDTYVFADSIKYTRIFSWKRAWDSSTGSEVDTASVVLSSSWPMFCQWMAWPPSWRDERVARVKSSSKYRQVKRMSLRKLKVV